MADGLLNLDTPTKKGLAVVVALLVLWLLFSLFEYWNDTPSKYTLQSVLGISSSPSDSK